MNTTPDMSDSTDLAARLHALGWKPFRSAGRFMALAGPLWARREDEGWAYAIAATDAHLNPAGVVHGGLLATLMDHALSTMAWEAAGRLPCVTVQLDTHFLDAVPAGALIEARGRLVRRTARLLFMQGTLSVDGNDVLAAQAVMKVRASMPVDAPRSAS